MSPFHAAFFAGFAIAFGSLVITVGELLGTWQFVPVVFRLGLPLQRRRVALASLPRAGSIIELPGTPPGLAKVVASGLCLFRSQFRLFAFYLHTPFPLRGTVKWREGEGTVELRLPIGTPLFILGWLIAWTGGSFMLPEGARGDLGGLGMFAFGMAFASVICAISLWIELSRARALFAALAIRLAGSAA